MSVDRAAAHIPAPATGSYPMRAGNLVRPLIDGVPAFRRISAAIDDARQSVWATFTFVRPGFQMPDGRGSLFDTLDRAAARGLDVRVIFWRPNPESAGYGPTFPGAPEDHALLRARGTRWRIRWDRSPAAYCQHQKSWLIDAGAADETGFVGGINPSKPAGEPGHGGADERHDLHVEIAGPAATDIHHNFVQRWNEASERELPDGRWPDDDTETLRFPSRVSAARGTTLVQIQRNVPEGRYADGSATPGGAPFAIAAGERVIVDQYLQAIDAARRTIYIENQALPIPLVSTRLLAALDRGVDVVLLVPAAPEPHVARARADPAHARHFAAIEALGTRANFMLAGIAGLGPDGRRRPVHVHAKIMLVDDAWATIGSCNLHSNSLGGHTEMNASIWDGEVTRALRRDLLAEHLGADTGALDDRAALALFRRIAGANRARHEAGAADWQGLAFALDAGAYGR